MKTKIGVLLMIVGIVGFIYAIYRQKGQDYGNMTNALLVSISGAMAVVGFAMFKGKL